MRATALAILLAAAAARASDVSDQLSVNSAQATATQPRSGNVSDNLAATFTLGEQWSIDLGATLTAESATPAASKGQFGTSGSVLTMFSLGADYDATDNWSFGLSADLSPSSTQQVGTDFTLPTASGSTVTGQALVQSATSQFDATAEAAYDTAGDSDLEWDFSAALTGSHESTDQQITRAHVGTVTLAQLKSICAAQPKRKVCQALSASSAVSLDSEKLSLSVTPTLYKDTDVSLSADLYHYEEDPASIAYPSLAAAHLGTGMPVAPLKYLARLDVLHRFGDFSAKLWVQAGKYEDGTGEDSTRAIGLKLQYKFNKKVKAWLTVSGQADSAAADPATTSAAPEDSKSSTISLGGQYRW